ncbi:hypothetical protein [Nocardia sputi]|uniref:hypothetical protein n=1 Tax=Nocardia sputi TaxID=2943705 RepID=UPI0020BD4701|nr:hypothetical protein [Nocardia sputi]
MFDHGRAECHKIFHEQISTEVSGVIGATDAHTLDDLRGKRSNEVAFKLAVNSLLPLYSDAQKVHEPWLVPQWVRATREWMGSRVRYSDGVFPG